jgi:hypothetical protein
MSVKKRRTLQVAALVTIFAGGMIAGQLLLFRDAILVDPTVRVVYLIEDAFFFGASGIVATLTFRIWWPYVWQTSMVVYQYDELPPYVQGWLEGYWTAEALVDSGWESAEAARAAAEQDYQEALGRGLSASRRQFREGLIAAQRESLQVLIEKAKR